jgi:hypothetical protein
LTHDAEADGGILWRRVGDETLIPDRESRRVCFLNATASRVWDMTVAGKSTHEIAAALCETYATRDAGKVRSDVEQCRVELRRLGLTGRPPQEIREDIVDEA